MNGVLLKDNTHEKEVYISDCIPLFHQVRILTVNLVQYMYLHCNCIPGIVEQIELEHFRV